MIKFENTEVIGWDHAIRGMRNPMNSWEKSDTDWVDILSKDADSKDWFDSTGENVKVIGDNDHKLMMKLRNAGTDHRKFMRMITVYVDITAPLYWWKEFDTYKVGTVANSCSTMHKIHAKEFTLDDFSCEHLERRASLTLTRIVDDLNYYREYYLSMNEQKVPGANERAKELWWQMIQLLPSSYNQKRTVMLNYEVLANIYKSRRNHKLDEWSLGFMDWIKTLPYSELITGEEKKK